MTLFDLSGRTAVVVGGTSGIGRALALGLADAGADVVSVGRRAALVDDVAATIERRGRRTLRCRPTSPSRGARAGARRGASQAFGAVDILVCAAGITKRVPTLEMATDDWQRIMETNVTGTLRSCQVFGRDDGRRGVRPHHHHRIAVVVRRACTRWRRTWRASRRSPD